MRLSRAAALAVACALSATVVPAAPASAVDEYLDQSYSGPWTPSLLCAANTSDPAWKTGPAASFVVSQTGALSRVRVQLTTFAPGGTAFNPDAVAVVEVRDGGFDAPVNLVAQWRVTAAEVLAAPVGLSDPSGPGLEGHVLDFVLPTPYNVYVGGPLWIDVFHADVPETMRFCLTAASSDAPQATSTLWLWHDSYAGTQTRDDPGVVAVLDDYLTTATTSVTAFPYLNTANTVLARPVNGYRAQLFVTGPNSGAMPGYDIEFWVGSRHVCTATTDLNGYATCPGLLPVPTHGYTARFAGSGLLLPSSGDAPLV